MYKILILRSSERQIETVERNRLCGYDLKAIRKVSAINTDKLIDDMKRVLSRFSDLEDDMKFTEIACLKNWPEKLTAGTVPLLFG